MRIGASLKARAARRARDRATVEEQTKIRTALLRALESEEWDALPGHAYVKGFLRTYAQLLGLDADALVDEYRRTGRERPQASPVAARPSARPGGRAGACASRACRAAAARAAA